ncbi:hypothetical protein [Colwellia echini]|uniref:Uncharacterized protein n=1 Tax=Colwellia echini TaxID=1982103 RepID=A0ABY3MSL5_9GAMM|nr:hypothetical protein [Colwellia echini]TYK64190.1 hypothetical protein CWS31_016960 [Colwellia echini]
MNRAINKLGWCIGGAFTLIGFSDFGARPLLSLFLYIAFISILTTSFYIFSKPIRIEVNNDPKKVDEAKLLLGKHPGVLLGGILFLALTLFF